MEQLQTLFAAGCGTTGKVCLNTLPQANADGSSIQVILSIVIGIVAAISLLFVVIGGLRYVLSQGDPGAVSKAKSTIVYALIGLAVCILAQTVVVFVIKALS